MGFEGITFFGENFSEIFQLVKEIKSLPKKTLNSLEALEYIGVDSPKVSPDNIRVYPIQGEIRTFYAPKNSSYSNGNIYFTHKRKDYTVYKEVPNWIKQQDSQNP